LDREFLNAKSRAVLRAPCALAGLEQVVALANAARLSLPTIQRMEASDGVVRGTV
jgi:hypothetical protein